MFDVVVCPLDLHERSYKILPTAADLARKYGSKLVFLHVNHRFMTTDEMMMLRVSEANYADMMKNIAVNARNAIQEAINKYDLSDIEYEIVLREGTPGHDIPTVAESLGADLIILSSTGRDHLTEMIIGTTAEAVLRRTQISVLTVHVGKEGKSKKQKAK